MLPNCWLPLVVIWTRPDAVRLLAAPDSVAALIVMIASESSEPSSTSPPALMTMSAVSDGTSGIGAEPRRRQAADADVAERRDPGVAARRDITDYYAAILGGDDQVLADVAAIGGHAVAGQDRVVDRRQVRNMQRAARSEQRHVTGIDHADIDIAAASDRDIVERGRPAAQDLPGGVKLQRPALADDAIEQERRVGEDIGVAERPDERPRLEIDESRMRFDEARNDRRVGCAALELAHDKAVAHRIGQPAADDQPAAAKRIDLERAADPQIGIAADDDAVAAAADV